eukprot:SAG22_NODE_3161_length_1891_cov_1.982701_1_plen_42_part_10
MLTAAEHLLGFLREKVCDWVEVPAAAGSNARDGVAAVAANKK